MLPTDWVYRIETDGMYEQKMSKLVSSNLNPLGNKKIDTSNIKKSLMEIAIDTQKIVSIELKDSEYYDVVGIVKKIENNICTILSVDEYGFEDGKTFIRTDDITSIRYDSEDENLILKLWKVNY